MERENIGRAVKIKEKLELQETYLDVIDSVRTIEKAKIEVVCAKKNTGNYQRDIIITGLGDEFLKYIISRRRLQILANINELEAELRNLK